MIKLRLIGLLNLFLSVLIYAQQKPGYYRYEGKLGPRDAVLEIAVRPSSDIGQLEEIEPLSSFYYFKDDLVPVALYKGKDSMGENIILNEISEDSQERFAGVCNDKVFKGKWYWNPSDEGEDIVLYAKQIKPEDQLNYFQEYKVVKVPVKGSERALEGAMTFSAFLPSDPLVAKMLTRRITKDQFDDFGNYAKVKIKDFEQSYKREVQEQFSGEDAEYSSIMDHVHNYNLYPVINTGQYLIMAYSTFTYTGGAHGMNADRYYNYSKKKKKWLQLEDVFDLSQKAAIEKVLDQELRRQYSIPPGIKLSEAKDSDFIADKIAVTDNFTLSKFNITFHYHPYELTPYAMGSFELSVPYENFKGLFKKGFHY